MKSLDELELLNMEQLKGIATSLGATPKANILKAQLVQLVYDLQQPDAPPAEENIAPPDATSLPEPADIGEIIDAQITAVCDFFEGTVEPVGEDNQGATLFAVLNLAGEEVARGTLLDLHNAVVNATTEVEAPLIAVEELAPPVPEVPVLQDTGNTLPEIEKALKAMGRLGLRYQIDGSVVTMQFGSKIVTTTLNQPARRVIRTAETLCNFR